MSTSRTAQLQPIQRPPVDEALIQEIVQRIVSAFHPRRIILFGSRARGVHKAESDVDLFVEMESDLHPIKRRTQIPRLFHRQWWSMDLVVKTPEEVARERNSLVSLVPQIEREGRVLHERSGGCPSGQRSHDSPRETT
ncbi:MAG: nucleotidyltransferase domain-containing protein [Planctomycetes bacterium]|nr:nucleotidyltransferase domain-containing protein [Planctomycetota bacterium]MBM4079476.1 nucleotidyltransferase domain-containing protein [Planctomycetota bacterium]